MALTNTGWPAYTQEEVDAVAAVLASNRVNYWTGDETRAFEREFAEWAGSPCAIALTNGTVALDLALEALGIGPGDEVVVTPRTFIASISTVVNAGATPVFADVGADSGNITPETISAVLTPRTRAIIPVHLGGWPCDMPAIMALAARADIKVVEDCAQAHGARIDGQSVGSFGHVGAWSFCQDKIMTTGGEGGMVTTADEALWSRMWSYKDHGKDWEAVYNTAHPPGFRWLHNSFGTNWRMLEMQAVIGRIQLRRMAEWTRRRTEIAGRIAEVLRRYPEYVRVPAPQPGHTHAYYRLYGYVGESWEAKGFGRNWFIEECARRGVKVFQGTCSEVYLEKAFEGTPWRPRERLPVARALGECSIMFLTHPTIDDSELARDCAVIAEVLDKAR